MEDKERIEVIFVQPMKPPEIRQISDELSAMQELVGGYIDVNSQMETNVAGVFAAGDIIDKSLRQIATAIADGAIAGTNAALYAKKIKG